jgi:hypothetical protein
MSLFLLVNNSAQVADVSPAALFLDKGQAIKALYEYEQASVFRPIVLYEYVLVDGVATIPKCFHRVKRNWRSVVDGCETIPINPSEFIKQHPFIFDKLEAFTTPSTMKERAIYRED